MISFTKYSVFLYFLFSIVTSSHLERRITGGDEVNPQFKYEFMVSLQQEGIHQSGGVILSPTAILTTALSSRQPVNSYTVEVHRHDLSKTAQAEQGQSIKVTSIVVHPQFDPVNFYNDLAIWKLAQKVTVAIKSITLDDGSLADTVGLQLITLGWGAIQQLGPPPTNLREVTIPIMNFQDCANKWIQTDKEAKLSSASQLCAGDGVDYKGTCFKDAGGPLFTYNNGNAVLVGITSFRYSCATNNPTVFNRISNSRDFINNNIY